MRILPTWYRQAHEEQMVDQLLFDDGGVLGPGQARLSWQEKFGMLQLAVRTHLPASGTPGAPARAIRRAGVVRALGLLGLLSGVLNFGISVAQSLWAPYPNEPNVLEVMTMWNLSDIVPIVALVLLAKEKRTSAKVAMGASLVSSWVCMLIVGVVPEWFLLQLPAAVAFACLCSGFHRDAPMPSVRRPAMWSAWAFAFPLGGALLHNGFLLTPWNNVMTVAAAVFGVRVVAFIRGDAALGRALSLFAFLLAPTVAVIYYSAPRLYLESCSIAGALLLLSVLLPVGRASIPSARLL
ncbi:hypothetical protein [Lentzea aerocolonigenes]|nr:hypothetical protein [Lentzea aerocolonigenes]